MKSLFSIFLLLGVCYSFEIPQDYTAQFNSFKATYGKTYNSPAEENFRKEVFAQNYKNMLSFNMMGKSYTEGINQFSDYRYEDMSGVMGFDEAKAKELYANSVQRSRSYFSTKWRDEKIPATKNWTAEGAVTPVKNQGKCGSCWAFSATGALEGAYFLKNGDLISESEQQLLDCSEEHCNGGYMENGYKYMIDVGGMMDEESYPYVSGENQKKNEECSFVKSKVTTTITSYEFVKKNDEIALRDAVATIGPIAVAIEVSRKNGIQRYRSGVYYNKNDCNGEANHAVLLVGYGYDKGAKMDYWLVKNSWGVKWGDNGYIKMARNKDNNCKIAEYPIFPIV